MNNKMQKEAKETVEELILQGWDVPYFLISGSHLYGTATETSDVDYRGVFFLKFNQRVGFYNKEDLEFGEDGKLFEIKKFVKLLSDNNPNMMEWLFAPKSHVFRIDSDFKDIVFADKQQFVNPALIQKKFIGYAMSEMSRLTSLTGKTGDKRRKSIEKYGYNVKSASNVMRIVTGGIDLISHGHLKLPYANKELLSDIKQGKYTLDEFIPMILPKIEKLKSFENLEDKTDQVRGYANGVLVSYIRCKYEQRNK